MESLLNKPTNNPSNYPTKEKYILSQEIIASIIIGTVGAVLIIVGYLLYIYKMNNIKKENHSSI
jgi:hypothetical protein